MDFWIIWVDPLFGRSQYLKVICGPGKNLVVLIIYLVNQSIIIDVTFFFNCNICRQKDMNKQLIANKNNNPFINSCTMLWIGYFAAYTKIY